MLPSDMLLYGCMDINRRSVNVLEHLAEENRRPSLNTKIDELHNALLVSKTAATDVIGRLGEKGVKKAVSISDDLTAYCLN